MRSPNLLIMFNFKLDFYKHLQYNMFLVALVDSFNCKTDIWHVTTHLSHLLDNNTRAIVIFILIMIALFFHTTRSVNVNMRWQFIKIRIMSLMPNSSEAVERTVEVSHGKSFFFFFWATIHFWSHPKF